MVSMDCVAVGWLVWVVLVAVVGVSRLVCVVFAVGWQLVAVCSVVLRFWGGAVNWPLAGSVVVGWVSRLVGGVGGISVIGLASGWLVGGLLERVLRGEVTLSVQDLVCDGCRGVAVEGGFVGGVWHFCGLIPNNTTYLVRIFKL